VHKAVVIVTPAKGDLVVHGFYKLIDAISFVDQQVVSEDKKATSILDALNDEAMIEGAIYNILDIQSYVDIYEDEDES
jgi:hypothetical protein